jgi:hypothetical protein
MRKKVAVATVALLAGALMLPDYAALARDGGVAKVRAEGGLQTSGSADTTCSSRRVGTKEWVCLHRPDGEAIYISVDQIVFISSAAAGAATRAQPSYIRSARRSCFAQQMVIHQEQHRCYSHCHRIYCFRCNYKVQK